MLKLTPILLALIVGAGMYLASSWRTNRMLDSRSSPLGEPRVLAQVAKLARALDLPQIKVHVFEIEPINGLAASDGRVFLTRGFLNKLRLGEVTPEELASVVAHELGHVALGHSQRRMIDFSGQNAIRAALTIVLSRYIPFIGAYIANFLVHLLTTRLTRSDEFEADAYAATLLTKAGIGVEPQVKLLEKLEKMSPSTGTPAWMMSHPKPEKRIEAISSLAQKWGGQPPPALPNS